MLRNYKPDLITTGTVLQKMNINLPHKSPPETQSPQPEVVSETQTRYQNQYPHQQRFLCDAPAKRPSAQLIRPLSCEDAKVPPASESSPAANVPDKVQDEDTDFAWPVTALALRQ